MRIFTVIFFVGLMFPMAVAQQSQSPDTPENVQPAANKPAANKKDKKQTTTASTTPDKSEESAKPSEPSKADANEATEKEEHYDVTEVPPVITHHQFALNGKTLSYTATTGRLPIKR